MNTKEEKHYELIINVYRLGELFRRPHKRYLLITASNPNEAREIARSLRVSSLSDIVKIMSLKRVYNLEDYLNSDEGEFSEIIN